MATSMQTGVKELASGKVKPSTLFSYIESPGDRYQLLSISGELLRQVEYTGDRRKCKCAGHPVVQQVSGGGLGDAGDVYWDVAIIISGGALQSLYGDACWNIMTMDPGEGGKWLHGNA
ncbi:hypothetical protein PIIN_02725 [Serendipita indica DSM 11827]|uniref:Uncharacterized protein n=1 Tax=Serendipita indica (strain DSM 11827) TaxID=1109443 RepID=G4TC22_SERID|nr:hypothetical protein PIIN_02725 [Serendipita indica DSM 11827]